MDAFTLVAKLVLNRDEFDHDLSGVEKDLDSDSRLSGFKNIGARIGRIAAQAANAAFNAVAEFGRSALETGMSFDAMMSQVKAVTGMTEDEFDAVRKRAMELGESTEWTAEQVGQAFYYMGLAGWKSGEMLEGIEPILSLASASGEDLGQTADIVTDALTAMGYQAKDAAHFADVLTAASTNSNTTVGMLGEAFKYLATTGGVLGYSIEDVATTLGLLANNGIKAGQAGTSMRQILNTLVNPTDKAAAAMEALGISLFEAGTDKRIPLMDVVQNLRKIFSESGFDLGGKPLEEMQKDIDDLNAWYDEWTKKIAEDGSANYNGKQITQKDLDAEYEAKMQALTHFNEDFLAKLGNIGGLRGISSLFALMKSTDDDVNQLQEAVNKSSEGKGAAKTTAEVMLDNLKGDITLLNSALDGLKILVSDEYNEKIRKFVQEITGGIGDISAAFKEGGASEAFASLTDWIINGITKTLTDPNITVKGANEFGQALGDFVGHLVASLIDNAPELVNGLFQAGINLAGGIVKGLFEGLFGSGAGTVYGLMQNAEDERDDLISDANSTAIEAQGIVAYMQTLVDKYGEAATNSKEWADSMDRLEQLIPGITDHIKAEGTELSNTTQNLKEYIEEHRQKAIEDAKNAYIEDVWKKYETAQVELGKAEVKRDIAAFQQEEAVREMARLYLENRSREENKKAYEWAKSIGTDADALINFNSTDEILQAYREGRLTFGELYGGAYNNQNYKMSDDYKNALKSANESFQQAVKDYDENSKKINELTDSAKKLREQFDIAKAAAERMANELGYGFSGEPPKPQAKGDWYVPYDNYPSLLHRGEMVLTASQARRYREGDGNMNTEAFAAAVVSAIRQGMENAQVNAYMDGRKVSEEVSRNLNDLLMEGRYA